MLKKKPKVAIEKTYLALFGNKLLYMSKSGKGDGVTEAIPQEAYNDILGICHLFDKNFWQYLIKSEKFLWFLNFN